MRQGTEAVVDGSRVALVDLSTAGVAVVSVQILKPNQSVRLLVEKDGDSHRAEGTVAWSSVHPGPERLSFRASIAFKRDQPDLLASLLAEADEEGHGTEPVSPPQPPQSQSQATS